MHIEGFDIEIDEFCELTEIDFFPPEDDRVVSSGVIDVHGGDCFYGYAVYFWDEYENDLFDCNN